MKKRIIKHSHTVGIKDKKFYEGETIETRVARMTQNKEPITDSSPTLYTEKKDGVIPAYNIRTDKWDIAQNAMDIANRAKIAQGDGVPKKEEQKSEETKNVETKSE